MKKVSIYKPNSIDEAMQMLTKHGQEAGVYAGGTDLLIRLKNRLTQAPTYLVDIKKIQDLRYIKEDTQGKRADRRDHETLRTGRVTSFATALSDACGSDPLHLISGTAKRIHHRR